MILKENNMEKKLYGLFESDCLESDFNSKLICASHDMEKLSKKMKRDFKEFHKLNYVSFSVEMKKDYIAILSDGEELHSFYIREIEMI